MVDEMSTLPPRLNDLEKSMHTVMYRVDQLERTHAETPHRLTKVEIAVERLPSIEEQLKSQGDMIKRGFILTHGILIGAGAVWAVFQVGPELLKFLGGR